MPKRILSVRSWSIIAGFALLAVVVAASALIVELQQSGDERVRRSLVAQAKISEALSVVQSAETGQRGYLLTGDRQYLEPYERAIESLSSVLGEVAVATWQTPGQRERFGRLQELIDQKLTEMRTTIARREYGDAVGALAIIHGDSGEVLSRQIRQLAKAMREEEARLLIAHLAEAKGFANMLRVGIVLAAIIILILGAYVLWQAQRRAEIIIRQRDELQAAYNELQLEQSTRLAAEGQMRQMQKMEAVGQLTGGVAHDFNNMLAVIMSSFELTQIRLAKGNTDIAKLIDAGMDAASRAATLTQRLLAFSRQQALNPTGLDPNELIGGMSDLLRRTFGADIAIESVLDADLWPVYADQGQLENAIVNLCVNARDAMPDGGRLTIETANAALDKRYTREEPDVVAGEYAMLAISDTGSGMSPDVLRRAFDPFFTTKEVGRGTGLGLSQVYGFVKQSGGHVRIYSEPDEGTTVKIYLPRYRGQPEAMPLPGQASLPAGKPGEVVLVVEDEERVRDLSTAALTDLGYQVLAADGAEAALRQIDERPDIALLLTDIVMPEVGGRKLAEEACRRRPDLKVLYTTGFTRTAVVTNGVVEPSVDVLQKPFTLEQLARQVRKALESARPGAAQAQRGAE